jgi:hypothetical protein
MSKMSENMYKQAPTLGRDEKTGSMKVQKKASEKGSDKESKKAEKKEDGKAEIKMFLGELQDLIKRYMGEEEVAEKEIEQEMPMEGVM